MVTFSPDVSPWTSIVNVRFDWGMRVQQPGRLRAPCKKDP